ncbi:uncharacterized protein Z518_10563 [Rhinocladiella mackenziei CBS 650.93]|uniref:Arsenite methyltransferase n=1 Tax=Rhinocladiella mackenziei CBS 650.93 TaxID=1442369 RepID=A0A0D2I3Q8_9EURO|nr:uncharacterized protein Z518_10563 [Rhinocladiella mackenziei CBS 650.93]KIX00424.1 hypothetical protein Z518_10563 [Rhinocladiella mackenziei CBS 650.93]
MDASTIYRAVNRKYSSIASSAHSDDQVQDSKNAHVATSFGYSAEDLASLPSGTNLGLSCGNPLATANIQPFDTMLDLGSGGGLDCLIAAKQMLKADASPKGKIYGVDRNENMIALARKNAAQANLPEGLVEFIEAPISDIALPDAVVDLIVSNCVINLVPDQDKPKVFREIYRLLKPGGRVAVSDLLAKKTLPEHVRRDAALLVGCVAGASLVEEYRRWMLEAGFGGESIVFVNTGRDLNVYHDESGTASCCATKEGEEKKCCGGGNINSAEGEAAAGIDNKKIDFNEWVASYQIYAVKGDAGQ